jgi:CubicO group peptidase (beta-lactamase class C family)
MGLRLLATTSLVAALGACTQQAPTEGIPSNLLAPPATEYLEAVDTAQTAARVHMADLNLPSVSVAVGIGGEVVWAEAFGWSDLSRQTPATPQTLYPVGSISKPLTATAAGLLYERGLLDFELPIHEYLPDFPEKRWTFTTGQVMGHIAGLRNMGSYEALRKVPCDDGVEEMERISEDTLLHEPGLRYRYSNYGYMLVGAVVEAVAGEPYLDFMQREVFAPLGLDRTIPDLGTVPGAATKYDRRHAFRVMRQAHEVDMSCAMAAGGFLSTPSELVRFGFAMLYAELLQQETVDLFWTPLRLNSGWETGYGYGWSIGTVGLGEEGGRTPYITHGGSVIGGRARLMILPDRDMVVVTMTNTSADVFYLSRWVAALFREFADYRSDGVGSTQ